VIYFRKPVVFCYKNHYNEFNQLVFLLRALSHGQDRFVQGEKNERLRENYHPLHYAYGTGPISLVPSLACKHSS
jgi:hypothetical protein